MYKKLTTLLLLSAFCAPAFAKSNFTYETQQPQPVSTYQQQPLNYNANQPLKGSVVMVPAGATMSAVLTTPLSSETAVAGQAVSLALHKDFYYNNKLIAPSGSVVTGTVIEASKAKHGSMNGKLCVRFTQINTPYGTSIPISAVIKTDDSTGVLVGGTKVDVAKEYTKDLAVGSAAGALSGLVFGALAGGSIGRGVALGTAVGAGGGLVKSAIDKGNDVEIPANAGIELLLTQPITTSASNYSYEN
jgi:hypothetical protein